MHFTTLTQWNVFDLLFVRLSSASSQLHHPANDRVCMDNLSVSSAATIEADQVNPVPSWRIFLVSVAALYLELVLIRWAGTEVRVFAYVQNLVLVTCFLGFGVGCLRSKQPSSVIQTLRDITLLVVIVSIPIVGYFGESNLSVVFGGLMFALSNLLTLTPDAAL